MLKSDIASLTIEVIYSPRLRHGIWQIVTIKMAHETTAHSSISSSSRISNAQWVIFSKQYSRISLISSHLDYPFKSQKIITNFNKTLQR